MEAGGRDAFSERPVSTDQVEDLYSGTKERSAWLLNVGSERFHEGRGAGKSTTGGHQKKNAKKKLVKKISTRKDKSREKNSYRKRDGHERRLVRNPRSFLEYALVHHDQL